MESTGATLVQASLSSPICVNSVDVKRNTYLTIEPLSPTLVLKAAHAIYYSINPAKILLDTYSILKYLLPNATDLVSMAS